MRLRKGTAQSDAPGVHSFGRGYGNPSSAAWTLMIRRKRAEVTQAGHSGDGRPAQKANSYNLVTRTPQTWSKNKSRGLDGARPLSALFPPPGNSNIDPLPDRVPCCIAEVIRFVAYGHGFRYQCCLAFKK